MRRGAKAPAPASAPAPQAEPDDFAAASSCGDSVRGDGGDGARVGSLLRVAWVCLDDLRPHEGPATDAYHDAVRARVGMRCICRVR
jgi:hypothetical protein